MDLEALDDQKGKLVTYIPANELTESQLDEVASILEGNPILLTYLRSQRDDVIANRLFTAADRFAIDKWWLAGFNAAILTMEKASISKKPNNQNQRQRQGSRSRS